MMSREPDCGNLTEQVKTENKSTLRSSNRLITLVSWLNAALKDCLHVSALLLHYVRPSRRISAAAFPLNSGPILKVNIRIRPKMIGKYLRKLIVFLQPSSPLLARLWGLALEGTSSPLLEPGGGLLVGGGWNSNVHFVLDSGRKHECITSAIDQQQ